MMKICVYGLWHLGSVTAACLAELGATVVGFDNDENTIRAFHEGELPVHEPGLKELVNKGRSQGNLSFTNNKEVLKDVDVLWVAFDTPVDDQDRADVKFVEDQFISIIPYLPIHIRIIISSQVPVGFTREIELKMKQIIPSSHAVFAYSPENLRLGKSIDIFTHPDRIVVGVREFKDRNTMEPVFRMITDRIEWMGIESAEMTKHAINAFLATSVTFANEIAVICEKLGVNAKEVERGLKTEERIGPKAYLGPGSAFAGGTLARDILFLKVLGDQFHYPLHVINAVKSSNDYHKGWMKRKLVELLGDLNGKTIAVLGLTYKPGTDTLRRSLSIELCKWLHEQNASIQAYDPKVERLPRELIPVIELKTDIPECLNHADCVIVATEWPEFRTEFKPEALDAMRMKNIIDMNGFLETSLANSSGFQYAAVGREYS